MDANLVSTQATSAFVVVWALQKLKGAKWFPMLQKDTAVWLQRSYSIVAAVAVHTGISFVWNPVASTPGYHQLIFTVPPLSAVVIELSHWAQQFIFQETGYQGYKAFSYVQEIAAFVEKVPPPTAAPRQDTSAGKPA